ncbi:MAG: hypothetical protein ABJB49_09560, partial [Nitrospirota bacterium]
MATGLKDFFVPSPSYWLFGGALRRWFGEWGFTPSADRQADNKYVGDAAAVLPPRTISALPEGRFSRIFKGMEVHLTNPELQAKLDRWVTETGRGPDELVEDAMASYFDELAQTIHHRSSAKELT